MKRFSLRTALLLFTTLAVAFGIARTWVLGTTAFVVDSDIQDAVVYIDDRCLGPAPADVSYWTWFQIVGTDALKLPRAEMFWETDCGLFVVSHPQSNGQFPLIHVRCPSESTQSAGPVRRCFSNVVAFSDSFGIRINPYRSPLFAVGPAANTTWNVTAKRLPDGTVELLMEIQLPSDLPDPLELCIDVFTNEQPRSGGVRTFPSELVYFETISCDGLSVLRRTEKLTGDSPDRPLLIEARLQGTKPDSQEAVLALDSSIFMLFLPHADVPIAYWRAVDSPHIEN